MNSRFEKWIELFIIEEKIIELSCVVLQQCSAIYILWSLGVAVPQPLLIFRNIEWTY